MSIRCKSVFTLFEKDHKNFNHYHYVGFRHLIKCYVTRNVIIWYQRTFSTRLNTSSSGFQDLKPFKIKNTNLVMVQQLQRDRLLLLQATVCSYREELVLQQLLV